MADILIRGTSVSNLIGKVIEIGYDAADCLYAFVDNGATDILEAIELPEHEDLVEADHLRTIAYARGKEYGCVAFVDPIDIAIAPVIVPSNKENKNAN